MRGRLAFLNGTPVGHYRAAWPTGLTTGLAAGNPFFSIRWPAATFIRPLITRLRVAATLVTPFTAANEIAFAAFFARNFSAPDTGGTPLVVASPNNMLNSLADAAMSCTGVIATTGTLTAGTRALDTNPFLYGSGMQTLAAASAAPMTVAEEFVLLSADSQVEAHLQNGNAPASAQGGGNNFSPEGIVITCPTAQGAGGTVRYVVSMDWIEYAFGPGMVPGIGG